MLFKTLNTRTKLFLLIQCLCMLIGTTTHALWIAEHGIYATAANTPFYSTLFWDSLTFLDLLAALLLIFRPKTGIILTLVIIVTDVLHNYTYFIIKDPQALDLGLIPWATKYWMLVAQLLFMIFVCATFYPNYIELKNKIKERKS